jgi:hypothetical protein
MNGREDAFYYPRLLILYPEVCLMCGKTPMQLGVEKLEIHEIKYERPLKLSNMRFLCHGCNNIKELNKENVVGGTETAPAIYQISKDRHPYFLEFVAGEMMNNINNGCEFQTLVADACLYTGMKWQTVINWMKPLWIGKNCPYILWGDVLFLKGKEPRGKLQDLPKRDEEFKDTEKEEMK